MEGVAYLESEDVSNTGVAPYVGKGKPVIVLVQGNFCGYCTQAKPAFQEFSRKNRGVVTATILIDGTETEKQAAEIVKSWNPGSGGVPAYIGFDKTGKLSKVHTGGRDVKSLEEFSMTL